MTSGYRIVIYADTTQEELRRMNETDDFALELMEALAETKTSRVVISRVGGWHWKDLPYTGEGM